jgi:hypothetical protein
MFSHAFAGLLGAVGAAAIIYWNPSILGVREHALPRQEEAKGGAAGQRNNVSPHKNPKTIEQLHKISASTYHVAPINHASNFLSEG